MSVRSKNIPGLYESRKSPSQQGRLVQSVRDGWPPTSRNFKSVAVYVDLTLGSCGNICLWVFFESGRQGTTKV